MGRGLKVKGKRATDLFFAPLKKALIETCMMIWHRIP
jgi:hypothetical protein